MTTTTLTRPDCKRDNVKVICRGASLLGFGRLFCKRGNWVVYEIDNNKFVGRSLGRVTCEGITYIEVAQASESFSSVFIRWVKPEDVREVRPTSPKRVLEFFAVEHAMWCDNIPRLLKEMEHGVSDSNDQLKAYDKEGDR